MEQPLAATHPRARAYRTLLVEPDEQAIQALELELSVRGQTVATSNEVQSALTAFKDDRFDIVIIGEGIADDDASWLCREIRALPGGDAAAIVVSAGREGAQVSCNRADAGPDVVLDSPLSGDSVGDQIEQVVVNRTQPGAGNRTGSSERFLVISPNGKIRSGGPVTERLLGFPSAAIVGVNAFTFFHADDAPQLLSIITEAFATSSQTRAVEVRVRLDGDSWRTIAISAENRSDDPDVRGIAFNLRGPDASVGVDDQVTRATMHDRVTDLPNRNLFIDRVDHAIVRSVRSRNAVVVLAIDFNDFASHGDQSTGSHDDGLVIAVARRLSSCLRSGDTAARIGHDQFGVLLEDITALEHIDVVTDRIIHAMMVPFVSNGSEVTLSPHIGISVGTDGRERAIDLLRDASIARAWARVQGAGSRVMFDQSMQPPADEPATSEFTFTEPATNQHGLFDRLDRLDERIATIEQRIADLNRAASTTG